MIDSIREQNLRQRFYQLDSDTKKQIRKLEKKTIWQY